MLMAPGMPPVKPRRGEKRPPYQPPQHNYLFSGISLKSLGFTVPALASGL